MADITKVYEVRAKELDVREARIEKNINSGNALNLEIAEDLTAVREKKLWDCDREYRSFKDYGQKRWKFEEARLYQLLNYKDFLEENTDIVGVETLTEGQTRQISRLKDKGEQKLLTQKAIKEKMSYRQIEDLIPVEKKPKKYVPPEQEEQVGDLLIYNIQEDILPDKRGWFERVADDFNTKVALVKSLKRIFGSREGGIGLENYTALIITVTVKAIKEK